MSELDRVRHVLLSSGEMLWLRVAVWYMSEQDKEGNKHGTCSTKGTAPHKFGEHPVCS